MRLFKYIYLLFLLLLLLPFCQQQLKFFEEEPLQGYFQKARKPQLSRNTFLSSGFQDSLEVYENENFGFRNFLLRFRNQCFLDVFHQSPNSEMSVGEDGYLFENKYLEEYFGNNRVGDSTLRFLAEDIHSLQDTLANHHIVLLTVLAPSKPYFFPGKLPQALNYSPEDNSTNYKAFSSIAQEEGLHLIDFNRHFLEHPELLKHDLYSVNGAHWSLYAATRAFDSILKRLSLLSGKQFPELVYENETKETGRKMEDDLPVAMNLLHVPVYDEDLVMPDIKFRFRNNFRPDVLGVADSYYGIFEDLHLIQDAFVSGDYWFGYELKKPIAKYDTLKDREGFLEKEIMGRDAIILLCTPPNVHHLSWGFVQEALAIFRRGGEACKYDFRAQREFEEQKYFISHQTPWFQDELNNYRKAGLDPDRAFDDFIKRTVVPEKK